MATHGKRMALGFTFVLILTFFAQRAWAADDCAAETAQLQDVGRGVTVRIDRPKGGTAGEAIHVSWETKTLAPLKQPLYIVVAIPGDVRFAIPPLMASANHRPRMSRISCAELLVVLMGFAFPTRSSHSRIVSRPAKCSSSRLR